MPIFILPDLLETKYIVEADNAVYRGSGDPGFFEMHFELSAESRNSTGISDLVVLVRAKSLPKKPTQLPPWGNWDNALQQT